MPARAKILIVEDDPDMREVTGAVFRQAGYDVASAETGQKAWEMIGEMSPDLLLLDVHLPDVDGRDLCRRIKADPVLATVFVVLISGAVKTPEDIVIGLEAGADTYLNRPITMAELLAQVNALIRIRRREQAREKRDRELTEARQVALSMMQDADIARHRTEDALRQLEKSTQSLRLLSLAIENSPAIVIITDARAQIEYVNPQFTRVTGYEAAEVLGKNPRLLKSGQHPPAFYEQMWATLASGRGWRGEICNRKKNGELFWELTSIAPVKGPTGEVTHYVGVKEDLAERKRVEAALTEAKQQAESASRAKSMFLANMSHEIRTPMNAILGFSQLMRRDPGLSERQKQHLDTISRSGEHLLALINNILEMSKIEAGRVTLMAEPCNLAPLLHDVESMFAIRAGNKGLSFAVEQVGDLPGRVIADELKLRQVLINLVGNAVKFTRQGGVVLRVRAQRDPEGGLGLVVEVEDTGPGIAPDEMGRLFRSFEQTRAGRQAGVGTGLGLALSREYVLLMGGSLQVRSEVGKGSVFWFGIHLAPAGEGEAARKSDLRPVLRPQPAQAAPRILVVDDHKDNRDLLVQLLTAVGFEVREAVDGADAVRQNADWAPQLVLMDLWMPGMDGREAISCLRSAPGGAMVKIIVLTAGAAAESEGEVLAVGADDWLTKPYQEADLLDRIGRLLNIEYESAPPAPGAVPAAADPAEAIARLPGDLVGGLRRAVQQGDIVQLESGLQVIAGRDAALARSLRLLVERYDYDTLSRLLISDPKEPPNPATP